MNEITESPMAHSEDLLRELAEPGTKKVTDLGYAAVGLAYDLLRVAKSTVEMTGVEVDFAALMRELGAHVASLADECAEQWEEEQFWEGFQGQCAEGSAESSARPAPGTSRSPTDWWGV